MGSGKTTAIQQACTLLRQEGKKVAVVTNDQGEKLVDTAYMQSSNVPVRQVTNGCFCCRYTELEATLNALRNDEMPEIIFAETVGSCTDLIATVAKPLSIRHPEYNAVISVFADASLLHQLLTGAASFVNDDVRYIYKKQLLEADVLIINKIDLLSESELALVNDIVASEYGGKRLLFQNSLGGKDIQTWLQTVDSFQLNAERASLEIDYDTYASGEAMMAWLDAEVEIKSITNNAHEVTANLTQEIYSSLREEGLFIGHLKFLVDAGSVQEKISVTSTDGSRKQNVLHLSNTKQIRLLINARVQCSPEKLQEILFTVINNTVKQSGAHIDVKSLSAFQPGYPRPSYRIAD